MTFQIKKHLIINEMKQLPEFQYTFPMYFKQGFTVVSISNFNCEKNNTLFRSQK